MSGIPNPMEAFDRTARTQASAPEQRIARRKGTPSSEALAVREGMLGRSPRVQSQLQLQQAMDASPRVTAQAKFAEEINHRRPAVPGVKRGDESPHAVQRHAAPAHVAQGAAPVQLGHHDLGGAEARGGASAEPELESMHARAFTTGLTMVFGATPDLRTATQEGAHVIQQRSGLRPRENGGTPDDPYERNADAVAERVVAGESAEPLLDDIKDGGLKNPPHVLQRKINYDANSKLLDDAGDRDRLIKALMKEFGRLSKEQIIGLVDDIEGQKRPWSLRDVYNRFSESNKKAPISLPQQNARNIVLPEKENHQLDLGFTTKTRLGGKVVHGDGKETALSEYENKGGHAEKNFIEWMESKDKQERPKYTGTRKESDTLRLTINNSPCNDCAEKLAEWKKEKWPGQMRIRYANPYGRSPEDFAKSKKTLKEAGIKLSGFNLLKALQESGVRKLDTKQENRIKAMLGRQQTTREYHRQSEPDLVSEAESEEPKKEKMSGESKKSSKQVRKKNDISEFEPQSEKKYKNEKQSEKKKKWKEKYDPQEVDDDFDPSLHNVSGLGMSCLIRALYYGATGIDANNFQVGNIRQHVDQQAEIVGGTMLDLAGTAGAILISYFAEQNILAADRGIEVYTPTENGFIRYTVIHGVNPIRLHLDNEHFQTIT